MHVYVFERLIFLYLSYYYTSRVTPNMKDYGTLLMS